MAVVTISRQFGSEGNYIGAKVAEALGYRFVFKKEINEIFEQYNHFSLEKFYYSEKSFSFGYDFDKVKLETMERLAEIIQTLAYYGNCVIVGRCGCTILRDLTDVLNVRIQAPLPIRTRRIIRENITVPDEAEHLVKEEDRKRAQLFKMFFNFSWDDPCAFDMIIDTGKVFPDWAVSVIVEVVKHLEEKNTYNEPNTRAIKVDSTLNKVISEVLDT